MLRVVVAGPGVKASFLTTRRGLGMAEDPSEEDGHEDDNTEPMSPLFSLNKQERYWGNIRDGEEAVNKSNRLNDVPSFLSTKSLSDYGKFSDEVINGAAPVRNLTVRDQLGALTKMTRPANIPGVCLFHMLGVYLALERVGQLSDYWRILLADPTMWLVLSTLILVSSTSMVVNDYYDSKLGRDVDPRKPLVSGAIPMPLARRYLSYLYAMALICVAFVPSVAASLSVVLALMLTYWYTKHLKPITWTKNLVCAVLIAFSPFTSAAAALYRTVNAGDQIGTLRGVLSVPSLWRLVSVLFIGFVGREMTMDCNDVAADQSVGVFTVPVKYGTAFASRVALGTSLGVALLTTLFPALDVARLVVGTNFAATIGWTSYRAMARLLLALIGSSLLLRRSLQVYHTKGQHANIVRLAVEEGRTSILFLLGSFV